MAAAALSLRTIGHSKQSEVIGQTRGVRPPPASRSSEPQRAGKLAGKNVTFWKTSSRRLNRGRVNTRSPADNRGRDRGEPHLQQPQPGWGPGRPAGLRGAGRRARLSRVLLRPRSEGLLSPARPRVVLSRSHIHIQAGGSQGQAAQIHLGRPRVTPTGSALLAGSSMGSPVQHKPYACPISAFLGCLLLVACQTPGWSLCDLAHIENGEIAPTDLPVQMQNIQRFSPFQSSIQIYRSIYTFATKKRGLL